jgi:hypothetical protein
MSMLVTSNVSVSLRLLSPDPQDSSTSMHPMGVDGCPGIIPWNMLCTRVRAHMLRPISMNAILIMWLREATLSIRVLATLCHSIGSLTMKGKIQLESSVS